MSNTHDIDNEEPLFQFDPYDEQSDTASSSMQPRAIVDVALPKTTTSHDGPLTSGESDVGNEDTVQHAVGKGKEKTMPMPIRASIAVHDLFDLSPPSVTSTASYRVFESSSSMTLSPASSGFSSPDLDNRYRHRSLSIDSMEGLQSPETEISSPESPSGKGKEKESFPLLPPLTFSVIQLDYGQVTSSDPGPSSYGASFNSPPTNISLPPAAACSDRENSALPPPRSPSPDSPNNSQDKSKSHITRCRSLSNLSQPLSPSLEIVSATTVNSQSSFGPSHVPSNISRQLVLDNNNDSPLLDSTDNSSVPSTARSDLMTLGKEPRSYPPAWYTASKPLVSSATAEARTAVAPNASPFGLLKGKARSKSSPYPISALDYVPVASSDIFQPLPIVVLNYFDLILPKELRLHILRALVDLHEQDYSRSIREGRLTMARATSSKGRWVGRDKGVRELFKLSRVSKAWKALVFDGELWTDLDLRSFSGLPPALLVRLVKSARTFIRSLDFAGHVQLLPDAMSDITNNLCLTIPEISLPYTQLTTINFQGCTLLTTRSLHHLFVRSKSLRTLSLKGLSAVTNTTCDIIANFCPQLTSLNVSRCPNVDGHGISALTVSAILRREHLPLKELHLSGLKHVSDSMMQALGRAAPYLEVLDLSYARQLHNSALEAFVACDTQADQQLAVETVIVSARDLGRDANESGKFRRRVTRLRHLVLSSCILLSDTACSNLAHSVPKLEFLELAGIGGDLKDDGLVRLLSTTPYIRRLDLEDASDITDSLLATITPASASEATANAANKEAAEQPGQALQQLNISFAANVTDSALLALMRNCTRLTILEADNTRIGPHVLKEFINLSRQRKAINSRIVVIDCRGISESLVKELSPMTRPRLGWRAYGARKLMYLDARDDNEEDLKLGQDECDESRVVLKTFYSWQTVDAVQAAKEKRRKTTSRRTASDSSTGTNDQEGVMIGRSARWWSPGGRRATVGTIGRGRNSPPVLPELNNDGCRTM